MAYEFSNYSVKVTLVCGTTSLASQQYRFVKLNSAGKVEICSADTDIPIGVLQNAPAVGEEAEVLIVGGTKIVAGAAITLPSGIATDANGKAVAVARATTSKFIVGSLITASAADGNVVTAVINCANAAN